VVGRVFLCVNVLVEDHRTSGCGLYGTQLEDLVFLCKKPGGFQVYHHRVIKQFFRVKVPHGSLLKWEFIVST
jgi:hypothetical protein